MDARTTGALIAARRRALELSQAELAERLHVTDKAVSRWETGRGMPGLDSLEPLSEALGLSVNELLSGKELTIEELPKAAGGQIMESMRREHVWKWLAWLALAAVTALAVWGIGVSVRNQRERAEREAHYAASAHFEDEEALARMTAAYFEDRSPKFNAGTLTVRKRSALGDYLAVLCADRAGEWCMTVWQKDELYPDRYCPIGGRVRVEPGVDGLMIWNFGDVENAVVVASGVELPEEAWKYEWHNGGTIYTGGVTPAFGEAPSYVLDVYQMTLEDERNQISPHPALYDDYGNAIRRD